MNAHAAGCTSVRLLGLSVVVQDLCRNPAGDLAEQQQAAAAWHDCQASTTNNVIPATGGLQSSSLPSTATPTAAGFTTQAPMCGSAARPADALSTPVTSVRGVDNINLSAANTSQGKQCCKAFQQILIQQEYSIYDGNDCHHTRVTATYTAGCCARVALYGKTDQS